MSQPGTPLAVGVLEKYGIRLVYLAKEALEQLDKEKAEGGLDAAGRKWASHLASCSPACSGG